MFPVEGQFIYFYFNLFIITLAFAFKPTSALNFSPDGPDYSVS